MNVELSTQAGQPVRRLMASGEYASESVALESDLQAPIERNCLIAASDEYLKREMAIGAAELDRAEGLVFTDEPLHEPFDEIKNQGRAVLENIRVDAQ